jgi:hypothetical protein
MGGSRMQNQNNRAWRTSGAGNLHRMDEERERNFAMKSPFRKLIVLSNLVVLLAVLSLRGAERPVAQKIEGDAATFAAGDSVSQPDPAEAAAKGSELFQELVARNDDRTRRLESYTGIRQYELRNDKDQLSARTVVRVEFRAPDTKTFETVSEEGSKWIRRFVFKGLIDSEAEAAGGREHRDSSITPHNYAFRYLGEQDLEGEHCYVVYATPKRTDKYLFEGQVWIDSQDFAVSKIAGHPAKNPSFWIKRVDWVRRYGKIGDFWLPVKDETLTDVRIFGKKKLIIDYKDYVVNQPVSSRDTARPGAN